MYITQKINAIASQYTPLEIRPNGLKNNQNRFVFGLFCSGII
ncbi:hypothetical protein PSE_1053 [Pseudovibrio sp. FO-BEG1]|nr:hypothetical protein PSE_1053 [Pseudovibrio sp. FO-BEG1]